MHPILNIALKAARRAGDIILRAMDRPDRLIISEKQRYDFVTDIDHKAEKEIINTIRHAYPSHGILAEESGKSRGDEFTWIIDPLDGTTNFIHGIPHFCVSIGISYRDRLEHALIYNPVLQELFTATRGQGAQLNNHRIRVSPCPRLEKALLATGLPYRRREFLPQFMHTLAEISAHSMDIRRSGSAALDLAYVAAGRIDGYWEHGLGPWDIAAGALLVKEAGGLIADFSGGEKFLETGNIVAANAQIFSSLLRAVGISTLSGKTN